MTNNFYLRLENQIRGWMKYLFSFGDSDLSVDFSNGLNVNFHFFEFGANHLFNSLNKFDVSLGNECV